MVKHQNNKNSIKKICILAITLLFICLPVFTGCQKEDVTTNANNFLTALSRADLTSSQKYVCNQYLSQSLEPFNTLGLKEQIGELIQSSLNANVAADFYFTLTNILTESRWEFSQIELTETTGKLQTDLTVVDFQALLQQALAAENCQTYDQLWQKIQTKENQEHFISSLYAIIKQPSLPKTSQSFTINLKKQNDQWLVNDDQQLYDSLTNGLFSQMLNLLAATS